MSLTNKRNQNGLTMAEILNGDATGHVSARDPTPTKTRRVHTRVAVIDLTDEEVIDLTDGDGCDHACRVFLDTFSPDERRDDLVQALKVVAGLVDDDGNENNDIVRKAAYVCKRLYPSSNL